MTTEKERALKWLQGIENRATKGFDERVRQRKVRRKNKRLFNISLPNFKLQ